MRKVDYRIVYLEVVIWHLEIADEGSCPTNWLMFNGNCYRFYDCMVEWTLAETECRVASPLAHLVSIHSDEENAFVHGMQGGQNDIWIGMNDRQNEGVGEWTDGSDNSYVNWLPGEPDNSCGLLCNGDCVEMQVDTSYSDKWNLEDCALEKRFICKQPSIKLPQ
ncbi:C-type lectin-like [Saccoglossus kowalevskii]